MLVAHYTVAGSEADNGTTFLAGQDVVILPDTIDAGHFTLACFGHIHHPQQLNCHTPAFYCGSPNQLTFNDEGALQGFYVHEFPVVPYHDPASTPPIPAGDTHRFVPTPARRHFTMNMPAEVVGDFITSGATPELPVDGADAVVRVRYSCSAEQEKAFNRAELQKKLMAAGAFYVAEVLPEDVEDTSAHDDLTEHDGPVEALERWLEANSFAVEDAERLRALARPIIQTADDGRDAGKHTGAFIPLRVRVENYRSYTDADFDFSDIHMAMVNGANGIGKSSMFMDSVADCLFEQSRQEDVGGWVRDGTKSGSVTFEFSMGGAVYRVIRTRTKAGRGTLALHRMSDEEWADESDTTMRLTQARIERLLGMDCGTFCSIALIRQDAYGLFLEAGSDRRMEVLSALLGLEVYTRMEAAARAGATDGRRKIAATNERLSALEEQIAQKDALTGDEKTLAEKAKATTAELSALDAAVAAAQRAEATREELLRQVDQKKADAGALAAQADAKRREADAKRKDLDTARDMADKLTFVEFATGTLEKARAELGELAPKEEELRTLKRDVGAAAMTAGAKRADAGQLRAEVAQYSDVLARKEEITAAVAEDNELRQHWQKAWAAVAPWNEAGEAVKRAKQAVDDFLSSSRQRIGTLKQKIESEQKKTALLQDSRCPVGDDATCSFLSDALAAKAALPGLCADLEKMQSEDRAAYSLLLADFEAAQAAQSAIGDPSDELSEITRRRNTIAPLVNLAPQLEGARSKVESLGNQIAAAELAAAEAEKTVERLKSQIPELEECAERANKAREAVSGAEAAAKMLPECKAAAATVKVLGPQILSLEAEALELGQRAEEAVTEAQAVLGRIPEKGAEVTTLEERRQSLRKYLNDIAADQGGVKARLEAVEEAENQAAAKRQEKAAIARTLNDYTTLESAFGLEGIQYMIIRGVVPEIMRRANDILAAMTGGRMAVDIRTEKEQRSTKQIINSLEVWITSLTGGARPYLSHSGGEKVKISLAVTLALADVKARRAGIQLGMLFIDEPPFLDADGTEAYADALAGMAARNPGMRILAISHDPAMKARFPQNITVSAGENGSVVSMD